MLYQHQGYTDKQLISNYIKGQQEAFETLYMRYRDRVYNYVYMNVRDHQLAEDIFQDAFIKVIHTLKSGKYNEEGKFLPWVMRIAHNLVIDFYRKSNKMPSAELKGDNEDFSIFDILKITDENREDELIKEQIYADLHKLVASLPDEQREVVEMRHFKGMSFKDIAERTNVSINTALGRMRYALINLRKLIEEHDLILID